MSKTRTLPLPLIILYRIYQLCIMVPLMIVVTIVCSLAVLVGVFCGGARFWSYWPGVVWARLMMWLSLCTVSVKGRENVRQGVSYVFVANHQGAYDIFAIYGWLGHNFKWMMKKSLEKIPFVGMACKVGGQIFVDKSSPTAIRNTMEKAEKILAGGMSVVVFPEGSRTLTGRLGRFKRGAFMLATEFRLPVVPITIDGAYAILPRTKKIPMPGYITLTIHPAIEPTADSQHDQETLAALSREAIAQSLPEDQR